MQRFADIYILYQLVKKLTTPFTKTEAYKRGIIDARGNVLRPYATLKDRRDKDAWSWLDILLNNLKRVFARLPNGQSVFFTTAAAIFLMREPVKKLKEAANLDGLELVETVLGPASNAYLREALLMFEDAPAMAAGHGAVAGIGVGAQGEPGVRMPRTFASRPVKRVSNATFQKHRRRTSVQESADVLLVNAHTGHMYYTSVRGNT